MFLLLPPEKFICRFLTVNSQIEHINVDNQYLIKAFRNNKLFALASENDVISIISHRLMDYGILDLVPNQWAEAHKSTVSLITQYLSELDHVAARLWEEGISLVALKNGGIARGIYPCPGCCPMGDLDVLVERGHFRKAHEIIISEGYHFEFRNPLENNDLNSAEEGGGAEYWKILPGGVKLWFELQWRPVAGRWIRYDQEPSDQELMSRSIQIKGTAVRLLAPEDNLLQVALHTAKHTYVRAPGFRLHLDVDRIVQAYPELNWDVFISQVRQLQVKTPVYFSLVIPKELFGTPIPDWVLVELKPPNWKERLIRSFLNRVGLFNPHVKKFGKIGYIVFNAMLYDDYRGLFRSLFPEPKAMIERYGSHKSEKLSVLYCRRLLDLAFRRVNT